MFRARSEENEKTYRLAVIGLLLGSAAALAITIWVMVDFLREQQIVEDLIGQLPRDGRESAQVLAGELRWQFRLTILVVLNLVVTGIAVVLLSRAYRSSLRSLRDLKALAGDILSSIDQAVITTDRDGRVTSMNRRGLELLDPPSEPVGRSLRDLAPWVPLDEFRQGREDREGGKQSDDFETTIRDDDLVLQGFCQTLCDIDDQEIGYVIQLRDVTDRIMIEERVRRMERYMGLGSLAAGLHHEIKNPLAALSLHVQLLEEQLDGKDETDDVRQMLRVIRSEVVRIGGVLEVFRDFASIDRLNLQPVDLKQLIHRQVDLIRPTAEKQRVVVEVRCPENDLPEVMLDPVRLEQVLLNLLMNALEAMPDGGHLSVQAIDNHGSTTSDTVKINVVDSGTGIPDELSEKVFDAYFTTKGSGNGLGLAFCDKIIRQHEGSLHFHSGSGGTTFEITLPIGSEFDNQE
ncbi:two-component system sensor histidine kinase NtrB [Crateriforma conspicua]|uniref:two-component system sensor histidine kinase NtrB n=1 Tax=Crateriforma conspicua TaxID=2527996 RepID=UPI0011898EB9|nr:ATP-binding protein [Crateriforma conspicua]QDV64046.1 Sensor protein ZraS [Crateriforma conspicua]